MRDEQISRGKSKKTWVVILCMLCIVMVGAALFFWVNSERQKNGVKNDRAVLYHNKIYFIKNRILYQAKKDGTGEKEIKKLPHNQMGQDGDGYKNIMVYNGRLYAIRWISYSLTNEYYIFSIDLDGSDYKKEVRLPWIQGSEGELYTGDISTFSIKNGYIYYTYILSDVSNGEWTSKCEVYEQKIGTTKRIPTRYYEDEITPQLSGKYAYYIKKNENGIYIIYRMDVESGRKKIYYGGKRINSAYGAMAILEKQLIFSDDTHIMMKDFKRTKDPTNYTEKKVTSSSKDGIYIHNANKKEVIYYNNEKYYRMDLDTQQTEEISSVKDMQKNSGIWICRVDQLGDTLAVSGYLDEEKRDEFMFFVKEKYRAK